MPLLLECFYCKGEHTPTACSEVTDYQKRLEIVRKANLCYNCLGNHKVYLCNSKFWCMHYRHKHHTSLCKPAIIDSPRPCPQDQCLWQASSSTTQSSQTTPTTQSSEVVAYTAPVLHDSSQVTISLLKTAIAPVVGEGIQIKGNILFDEGLIERKRKETHKKQSNTIRNTAAIKRNLRNVQKWQAFAQQVTYNIITKW